MAATSQTVPAHFKPGNRALMIVMGQRYLVGILQVTQDTVRVSFPVRDFPIEGMKVDLEFHDATGYTRYESEVLQVSEEPGDGLVLRRPPEMARNSHRSSWRVPADFNVQVKDHVHPRRHDVPVLNISAGGMLIRTTAELKVDDSVDLAFTLPGEIERETLIGRVTHVENVSDARGEAQLAGLRFVGSDPVITAALTRYIWRRLRELYPEGQLLYARRATDGPATP